MDKRRSFLAWLSLVLALMLLAGCALTAAQFRWHDMQTSFYESESFCQAFTHMVRWLVIGDTEGRSEVTLTPNSGSKSITAYRITELDSCGDIVYFYRKSINGKVYTNTELHFSVSFDPEVFAKDYSFVLKYDGELTILLDGTDRTNSFPHNYRGLILQTLRGLGLPTDGFSVFFAVGKAAAPYFDGLLAGYYYTWQQQRVTVFILIGAALAGIALLIVTVVFRRYRRAFSQRIVDFLGRIAPEVKLAAGILLLILFPIQFQQVSDRYYYDTGTVLLLSLPLMILSALGLWYLLRDFFRSPRAWLSRSLLIRAFRAIRRAAAARARQTPLERRFLRRFWLLITAEIVLIFIAALCFIAAVNTWRTLLRFLSLSACLTCIAGGVWLLWLFLRSYHALLADIETVGRMTAQLRAGHYAETLPALPVSSDLYPVSDDLMHLRDGISAAVDARVRSERMKSELVTNVSHDLKTPLTSIISYARLLDELHLDEPAAGYVRVLCDKSARLRQLTNDLFEVSRAQSGSLPLQIVRLDLKSHLEQTLAELSDRIASSGLAFRTRIPDSPVYVDCDGERLYRVLENLIINAVTYAMPGTRVYITLYDNDPAILSIQNVAAQEMRFTAEEIVERFARGDDSRTDGGTGLGLAIAKSFTEAVGGSFVVTVDGDVFRVTLSFPRRPAPDRQTTAPQPASPWAPPPPTTNESETAPCPISEDSVPSPSSSPSLPPSPDAPDSPAP